ncbi:hypothetical protein GCM10020366_02520 [Saccharopolyspora gregorii]|uniref:Uncharacterized protein n=1 Tax=Saccharopolyspora gregorii TaxID=33914 RepID=A0ABP6RH10_9PSEU
MALALDLGPVDGLADVLGGQVDRAGTAVDLGDAEAEVLREGPLDVGDGTRGGLDGLGDLVAALAALADARPRLELLALALPGAAGRGAEVLLEVVRGAGLVGAEERDDGEVRQLLAGVQRGDRGSFQFLIWPW